MTDADAEDEVIVDRMAAAEAFEFVANGTRLAILEALIKRELAPIMEARTTIVVAHRLSTVRDADRIVVLEDGRVAEVGSHEDLLERDGLYANLWRVQAGDVQDLPKSFLADVERRLGEAPVED